MNTFDQLQSEHEALLKRQLANEELVDEARAYIKLVQEKSAQVYLPGDRDQLRANLRYWANYLYEVSGSFPSIALSPVAVNIRHRERWLGAGAILVVLLLLVLLRPWGFTPAASLTSSPSPDGGATQAAATQAALVQAAATQAIYLQTEQARGTRVGIENVASATQAVMDKTAQAEEIALKVAATQAAQAALAQTADAALAQTQQAEMAQTEQAALTATAQATPPPSETPTPAESAALLVEISSPANGDWVTPKSVFRGRFSNLQPGWAIQLLAQPLSKGGLSFTLPGYFVVPEGVQSGEWAIETNLGEGKDLESQETYIIQAVVTMDEGKRAALIESGRAGFTEIPNSVIPFPALTTVRRKAYQALVGVRTIYSQSTEGNIDLFASLPDGSEAVQITNSPSVSELEPSLSADGRSIAYVGRRRDADWKAYYTLEVIHSDGTAPVVLLDSQPNVIYETPVWSSDGRYLAYAIGITDEAGQTGWMVQVYDFEQQQAAATYQSKFVYRYPTWLPDSHKLIFYGRVLESGTGGFYVADLDWEAAERVEVFYDTPLEEMMPAISPDQTALAFVGFGANEQRDLYLVQLESGEVQQLTDTPEIEFMPRWLPDGSAIDYWYSNPLTTKNEIGVYTLATQSSRVLIEGAYSPWVGYLEAYLSKEKSGD